MHMFEFSVPQLALGYLGRGLVTQKQPKKTETQNGTWRPQAKAFGQNENDKKLVIKTGLVPQMAIDKE